MRIALVNEYFPPHAPGGAEWSVEALARALAGRGHGVVGEDIVAVHEDAVATRRPAARVPR